MMTPLRFFGYALIGLAMLASAFAAECQNDRDWYYITTDGGTRSCGAVERTNTAYRCCHRSSPEGQLAIYGCPETCDNCDGSKDEAWCETITDPMARLDATADIQEEEAIPNGAISGGATVQYTGMTLVAAAMMAALYN